MYILRTLAGALLAAILAVAALPAQADHMTGRYSGTGEVTGSYIDLVQRGTSVEGRITGADQGTLQGRSDGGDGASGTASLTGIGTMPFEARWTPQGLHLRLRPPGAPPFDAFFAVDRGGARPEPHPPETTARFHVLEGGQQVGPMSLQDVVARIEAGTLGRADLVWRAGSPSWVAAETVPELADALRRRDEVTPPPPPGAVDYFVAEAGRQVGPMSRDELLRRIEDGLTGPADLVWSANLDGWTRADAVADLAEAFVEPPAPPPLPPPMPPPMPPLDDAIEEGSDDHEDDDHDDPEPEPPPAPVPPPLPPGAG